MAAGGELAFVSAAAAALTGEWVNALSEAAAAMPDNYCGKFMKKSPSPRSSSLMCHSNDTVYWGYGIYMLTEHGT